MRKHEKGQLLDTLEACEVAGLSYGYMRNLRYMGRGPEYIRHRGRVLYPEASLRRWIELGRPMEVAR